MKKTSIEISFEAEQLSALKQYMSRKELTIEAELEESLRKIYEKYVPQQVREYIETKEEVTITDKKASGKSKRKEKSNLVEAKNDIESEIHNNLFDEVL